MNGNIIITHHYDDIYYTHVAHSLITIKGVGELHKHFWTCQFLKECNVPVLSADKLHADEITEYNSLICDRCYNL